MVMGPTGPQPNFTQARQIARAYAALELLAAWDPAPLELYCVGAKSMALEIEYDEAAVGGAVDVWLQFSPYSLATQVPAGQSEWFSVAAKAIGLVAAGITTVSLIQPEINRFNPTIATVEGLILHMDIPGSMERFRVLAREAGGVAPGTCGVVAILTW